jgi:hypothetical protein
VALVSLVSAELIGCVAHHEGLHRASAALRGARVDPDTFVILARNPELTPSTRVNEARRWTWAPTPTGVGVDPSISSAGIVLDPLDGSVGSAGRGFSIRAPPRSSIA